MKKYTSLARKGFTLVELMIVIAIIGILAAVLYPGFTGFMEGARDSARTASLKNYTTALLAYQQDNTIYPKTKEASWSETTFCVKDLYENHLKKYMPKGVEVDSKGGNGATINSVSCVGPDNGGYVYRALKAPGETQINGNAYMLAAKMEKWSNANANASTIQDKEELSQITTFAKGSAGQKALENDLANAYYVVAQ